MLRLQDNVIDTGEHVKKAGDFASAVRISQRPAILPSLLQHPTLLQLTLSSQFVIMVRLLSVAAVFFTIVFGAQASHICQCLFQDGSHCCASVVSLSKFLDMKSELIAASLLYRTTLVLRKTARLSAWIRSVTRMAQPATLAANGPALAASPFSSASHASKASLAEQPYLAPNNNAVGGMVEMCGS